MDLLDYTEEDLEKLDTETLLKLVEECEDKVKIYLSQQMSKKILINSLYGALANKGFSLFNEKIAQSITGNGRFFIQYSAIKIENKLQSIMPSKNKYLVYGDTDSNYYHIGNIMAEIIKKNPNKTINEYVDLAIKFEEQFVDPTIQESIKEFAEMFNAHDVGAIGAKRELVADKCLFVAKKKYVARVRDKEGVRFPEDEPYPKVMGLDIARSAMPSWCKNKLKHEAIDIILDKTEKELKEWIDACKKEFVNQPISEICSYGTVSRIDYSLSDKGIPFMCKAGIYYNMYIKEHNLENKYTPIENDTSVKLMRLKTPNKFGTDLIAYTQDTFVDEFINDIDYDTQFNKSFVDAINNMTKVLHYDLYNKFDSIDEW